jgi:uncharacterized protein YcgI (DUF1989 family)
MKPTHPPVGPDDAASRRAAPPVVCYPNEGLPAPDLPTLARASATLEKIDEVTVPPREARCFHVPAHHFFRITSIEGPQVGDLNLWAADNLAEKFYSGKTRALHGTHLSTGDRLWSCFPYLRPLATITRDTLDWYGWDDDGASVHDVIGTRCDPYTARLLTGTDYHHCCHSNLIRALADDRNIDYAAAETHVHDVMNVFMCTGFTHDTHQYFMKASPVRPGDYIEFFAETALIGGLSACPGGDCGAEHSSDVVACHPLLVEIFAGDAALLATYQSLPPSPYPRTHRAPLADGG